MQKNKSEKKITVLDLYSGLGGLSLGFEMTGAYHTVGGIDIFNRAVETFYYNHPDLGHLQLINKPQDLSVLEPEEVIKDIGCVPDVIVGGPPCQGFSQAGRRLENFEDDERNKQVFNYLRFVKAMRPKAFVMENVPGILKTGQKETGALVNYLIKQYEKEGYCVTYRVVNSAEYRVPQQRKRVVLVGVRDSKEAFVFPNPICAPEGNLFCEPYNTVKDALSDLPEPTKDEPQAYEGIPHTPLERFLRGTSTEIHNHIPTVHSTEMVEKLKKQKPGERLYPNFNHAWIKLDGERPAPTVKENHRAPSIHYKEPRATSPRENARLQTIPDDYILLGNKSEQLVMVGNAVPAMLFAHIATSLAKQVFNVDPPTSWTESNNPLLAENCGSWKDTIEKTE